MPPAVEKAAAFLAKLPTDWKVFIGWPGLDVCAPDFLIVTPLGNLALVAVSGASASVLDVWDPRSPPGETAAMPLRRLHRAIMALTENPFPGIPTVLILTHVRDDEVGFGFEMLLPGSLRIRTLDAFTIEACQALVSQAPARPDLMDEIRAHIGKPSVILPSLAIQRPEETPKLRFLDSIQEEWLRRHLSLPEEAAAETMTQAGAHLLTGVAGCGKSLLLLYRATLERKLRPQEEILFVTHNKPLITDLSRRAGDLARMLGAPRVAIRQFLTWCRPWVPRWPEAVTYGRREAILRSAIGSEPNACRFFSEEFAWIQDHGIASEAEYVAVERQGRKRPVPGSERPRIWQLFQRYLAELERCGVTDFSGLTRICLEAAQAGRCPQYSLIFVDEAQFFAPIAIRTLRCALREGGRIVFAADPTQGFLQRRSPWAACGLDLRGRSTRLKCPYRSSEPILRFARSFYLNRIPESEPDLNLPTDEELASASPGSAPEVIQVPNQQGELREVCHLVRSLIQNGAEPHHVLVLHRHGYETEKIAATLCAQESWRAVPANSAASSNGVRVTSLDAATGLEAPYVVIMELRDVLEAEKNPMLGSERDQLILDNSRKIYMAFTRAGYRLLIVWSGEAPAPFHGAIDHESFRM